jgi:hypothetical protein
MAFSYEKTMPVGWMKAHLNKSPRPGRTPDFIMSKEYNSTY